MAKRRGKTAPASTAPAAGGAPAPVTESAAPPPETIAASERRRYPRLGNIRLMANIGGKLVRVVNVSAKGMTVERTFPYGAEPLSFTLYPSDGRRLDLNKGVKGTGIVAHEEDDLVGIRFQPATLALVRLVVDHADPPAP